MSTSKAVSKYACIWKFTPAGAQEFSEIVRGTVEVEAEDIHQATANALGVVRRERGILGRPGTDGLLEIIEINESVL